MLPAVVRFLVWSEFVRFLSGREYVRFLFLPDKELSCSTFIPIPWHANGIKIVSR